MKKTLSFKITLVVSSAMIIAMGVGMGTSLAANNSVSVEYAEARLALAADVSSHELNHSFIIVEHVVDEIRLLADNRITSTADLANHGESIGGAIDVLKSIYVLTAEKTQFVNGYFLVLNPEYTGTTVADEYGDGFFYVKNKQGNFYDFHVTNILKFDEAHQQNEVNWWYATKQKSAAIWIEPYYNAITDNNLITYATPFFSNSNELLGVVGVNIDYDELVESIGVVEGFSSGNAFLLSENNELLYHPQYLDIDENGHYEGKNTMWDDVVGESKLSKSGKTYHYTYNGQTRVASIRTLHNNWKYGVSVNRGELYAPLVISTLIPVVSYVAITLILIVILIILLRRLFKPLHQLNSAVKRVGDGDLNVEAPNLKGNDEIVDLSSSFKNMIFALRSERSAMNALAFQDGLTGVQNKAAQEEKIEQINHQIREGVAKFAVVMCDVNDLKVINDTFGHIRGDQAIRGACLALCKCFPNSQIYRIGGDEFVAILEKEDYDNRNSLIKDISGKNNTDESGRFHFSVGMATYQPGIDANYQSVFKRADEQMYIMKKKGKENGHK